MASARKPKRAKTKAKAKAKKQTRAELERELKRTKAALAKAKRKRTKKKPPAESGVRKYKRRIGKVTHVSAKDIADGEPQYTWRELEERAAPFLIRGKGAKKRWARLVAEIIPQGLTPDQYRRLRGKPVIRTRWYPAEELIGNAAGVVETLQKADTTTPRMKVVIVESRKKPPAKLF